MIGSASPAMLAVFVCLGLDAAGAEKITTTVTGLPYEVVEKGRLSVTVQYEVAADLGQVRLHVELKNPRNIVLAGQTAEVSGKGAREFIFDVPSRAEESEIRFAVWYGEVWTAALVPIIHTEPIAILSAEEGRELSAREAEGQRWCETMKPQIPEGGAAALLVDDFPGFDRGLADAMRAALEAQGLTVLPLNGEEVGNPTILAPANFHTLVLTSSAVFPLDATRALERFLAEGGDVIALGAPAFREPVSKVAGRWMGENEVREALRATRPERILFDFETGAAEDWTHGTHADARAEWEFAEGGADGTEHALHCLVPDYRNWNTFAAPDFGAPPGPGQSLTCLWARGGPQTTSLALEWVEKDGSRWIATIPLTTDWQYYVLTPGEFKYWQDNPSQGRGGTHDHVRLENAARFTVGLAMTHTRLDAGRHEFWVDQIGVAPNPLGEAGVPATFDVAPIEMLTPTYKFHRVTSAVRLQVSDKQCLLSPADLPVPEGLMSVQPRPQGTGYNKERKWRWIPLLEAFDDKGEVCGTPACLTINRTGRFSRACVASFALPPSAYASPRVLELVARLAARLRDGFFLFEGGAEYYAYFADDEQVTLGARTINLTDRPDPSCSARLTVRSEAEVEFEQTVPVSEGRAECRWSPAGFTHDTYQVICALLDAEGKQLDLLAHPLVVWRAPEDPDYLEVRDGDFYLHGRPWYAHGVNYMPSSEIGIEDGEYFEFWMDKQPYDPVVIERDLTRIKAMGMNMVSIFCYYRSLDSRNLLDILERCRRHGLMVNLSLRPGTGLDFRWDEMRALIETYRLAQNDTIFAYDLAWEPNWGPHDRRKPWDDEWERWIVERYGSVENAEADWGVPVPREDGKVTNPLDEHLTQDGPHRVMVAAYWRFLDDLLAHAYGRANSLVKSIDPDHLTSFRMSSAGDPTRNAAWATYDFRGLARSVDIMEPEGYGRIGDWDRVKPGRFTVDYARCMAPGRPVMWAEFGRSSWNNETMDRDPAMEEWVGDYYRRFYRMAYEAYANGTVCWYWPGCFRYGENSDYGVINADGTWRPNSHAIAEWAERMTTPRERPPVDEWIVVDRDAHVGGIVGVYEAVQERYWALVEQGKNPGLRTDGYGLDSATAPRRAVGNVPYRPGRNPHKYLNAEFDVVGVLNARGEWEEVTDGAEVRVKRGEEVRLRAAVGNLADATWLARAGDGQVGLGAGHAFLPIAEDVPFMGTAPIEGVLIETADGRVEVTLEMRALPDVTFGQKLRLILVAE